MSCVRRALDSKKLFGIAMSNTVEKAQALLDAANAAYQEELRQDSNRTDGSGAQEQRREARQQRLKDEVDRCRRALELAKKATPGT